MPLLRYLLLFILAFATCRVYGQQDMDLHLNSTFLAGKNILKVKRNFKDPYLWVLAQNNEVYRINSLTNAVDNYTTQFSAYSNLPFTDIAGRSQDSVFVTAGPNNVLFYKKGIIKLIGPADGIAGTINSISLDYLNNPVLDADGTYVTDLLTIATNNGSFKYAFKKEHIVPGTIPSNTRMYEATYRNEMAVFLDKSTRYTDTVDHYPALEYTDPSLYEGSIWLGGQSFGHNLRAAYYTSITLYAKYAFTIYANLFWATENGLFQLPWNHSDYSAVPHKQYLKGVAINKITSVYGLTSFPSTFSGGYGRENLLVGSDQGLYFSNSKYQYLDDGYLSYYTFYHYDQLGNKKINDICVNANSYNGTTTYNNIPVCEDGAWVAATDGLYLLKTDYTAYVNTGNKLQAIAFEGQGADVNQQQICAGAAVKALVQSNVYSGNNIQWYKDGQELPNESKATLTITQPGDYNAILYDACSMIHVETNHLKVTQIAAPVFTFNYPGQMNFCDRSTATFKTDDNPLYQYRWCKNGVIVSGQTTAGFTTGSPGKYKVEVSACPGTWVASTEVQANFVKLPPPVVKADKAAYCNGDEATLTATVDIAGLNIINLPPFQYQWFKDGVLLTGETGMTIKARVGGKYRVAITACSGGFVLSEDDFQIAFTTLTQPVISTDKPAYCIGDQATLSVNYPASGYTINWFLNSNVISAGKNKTSITTNLAGNYTVNVSIDQSSCSETSNPYAVGFENPPTISIRQIVNTTLCSGQLVNLQATFTGAGIKWSTGQSGNTITVSQSGTYTATATAAGGCTTSTSIGVQFLPNPTLSLPDATLCQFTNDQLTLTAPAGFVKYEWNGVAGTQSFTTGMPGQVNLTVTDQKGCKASQTINITSKCKDIHVPNTFTPNGDGINDKWVIAGLENDLSVNVKVFNRLGALVFESQGYAKAWDATRNGKRLPAGVYFYLINAKGSNQVLSGSITVIY